MTREEAKHILCIEIGSVAEDIIDAIYDDFDGKLEAKNVFIEYNKAQLKAKDEEIERLKAELNQDLLHMPDDVYNRQAKIKDTE